MLPEMLLLFFFGGGRHMSTNDRHHIRACVRAHRLRWVGGWMGGVQKMVVLTNDTLEACFLGSN